MGTQLDTAPLGEFLAMAVAYIIDTRERMLEGMVTEGLLTRRRTINGDAYEFTPPKQSTLKQ